MPRLTEIEATYQVVTPCFCGGADGRAEFRLPSFKGVLRFWWRALAWSRCAGNLALIRQQEEEVFGSADAGRSRVRLRLAGDAEPTVLPAGTVLSIDGRNPVGEGARYLGYGLMHAFASNKTGVRAGELIRSCLVPPFTATIQLRCRGLDGAQLGSLTEALTAVGLLGGMGSRTRRGYGSLSLQSLLVDEESAWQAPGSLDELCAAINALRPAGRPDELPEYTALSSRSRHVLLTGGPAAPMQLLDLVGAEFVRFRSSGRDGRILGRRATAEQRFKADHLLLLRGKPDTHPRRVAFGLPLNFGPHLKVGPVDWDRRASPLFIHIHQRGNDPPVAVVSFLPARFLPGAAPHISVAGTRVRQTDEEALYQPVEEFVDRLCDPDLRQEPFTEAVAVPA